MMMHALQINRDESIAMCKHWKNNGLDIVLCSVIGSDEAEIQKVLESNNLSRLAKIVARAGCLKMVKLCEKSGWSRGRYARRSFVLHYAEFYGFHDIVDLCEKLVEDSLHNIICDAAREGRDDIARLCKKTGARVTDAVMRAAATYGRIEIVELCERWGVKDFSEAGYIAAKNGHIEIVKLFRKWGLRHFDKIMCHAAGNGHIEITELCRQWGQATFVKP